MTNQKLCLDLFAGLGGFSAAFADSDNWRVVTVDIEERFEPDIQADMMDLRPSDLPDADVVLASPPCKEFSTAQNMNGGPDDKDFAESVALVYHALGLIQAKRPQYWFVENPFGRLRSVIGEPEATITYCQYGEKHQKPTDLWGEHPRGFTYRSCPRGASCHANTRAGTNRMQSSGKQTPAERAKVPYELSEAILEAVEGRAEQTTLTEATHD